MKILLDTHILLWAAMGELPTIAEYYIENKANVLYFSSASIWEIVIKNGLGHKDFIVDPAELYEGLLSAGYCELPITSHHTLLVSTLPQLHKDPFDRILMGQAMREGMPILTADKILTQYPCAVIYARL